jgi:hypothetical protein
MVFVTLPEKDKDRIRASLSIIQPLVRKTRYVKVEQAALRTPPASCDSLMSHQNSLLQINESLNILF